MSPEAAIKHAASPHCGILMLGGDDDDDDIDDVTGIISHGVAISSSGANLENLSSTVLMPKDRKRSVNPSCKVLMLVVLGRGRIKRCAVELAATPLHDTATNPLDC